MTSTDPGAATVHGAGVHGMLSRLGLRAKLICGFSLIALVAAIAGFAGIRGLNHLSRNALECEAGTLFSNAADDALDTILQLRRYEKDVFLNIDDQLKRREALDSFEARSAELKRQLAQLRTRGGKLPVLATKERELVEALPRKLDAYLNGFRSVIATIDDDTRLTPLTANRMMVPFKQQIYDLETAIRTVKERGDGLSSDLTGESIREAGEEQLALTLFVLFAFCLSLVLGGIVAARITRPLAEITMAADELSKGNCGVAIHHLSGDELGFLADSFRQMVTAQKLKVEMAREIAAGNLDAGLQLSSDKDVLGRSLLKMAADMKEFIRNLTEATAAKERIQSELKLATDIQTSLLPRIFPPFPDREEVDIFALMEPAKEVGGDFYDFFFIDERHLCFLIADVADKGIPAALYMMVAKTLLKTEAQRGGEPDRILFNVNNILAQDNENCMFVTVFCAILDTASGEVRFANAGHNPPLVKDSRGASYLTPKAGFVLGPIPGSPYETERLILQPGDVLLLYTDGVTEAKSPRAELFGEQRLLDAMQLGPFDNLTDLLHSLRIAVTRHADGAEQSDDVTMLAIRYRTPSLTRRPDC